MARKVTAEIELTFDAAGVVTGIRKVASAAGDLGEGLDDAGDKADKAQGRLSRFGSFLKSRFVVTLGDVRKGVRDAFNLIKESADLSGTTSALRAQLAQQGQSFDTFIAKLDETARGTVSTADLIKSSSRALLLGIPAEEIATLLDIARASSIATGQSVAKAFDDIALGIGRTSPLILDNLGLVVKVEIANKDYAEQLGKTVEQLTLAERRTALLNKVLVQGEKRISEFGESADATSIALQQGAAALEDFKIVAGKGASIVLITLAGLLGVVALKAVSVAKSVQKLRLSWNLWTDDAEDVSSIRKSIQALDDYSESITKTTDGLNTALLEQWNDLFATNAEKTEAANEKMLNLQETVVDTARVFVTGADATDKLTANVRFFSSASESAASVNKDELLPALQAVEQQLTRNAQAAANHTASFDRLTESVGRAAAVEAQFAANVAAGDSTGGLSLGRTRISIPGGSRLTSVPGFSNVRNRLPVGEGAFSTTFLGR